MYRLQNGQIVTLSLTSLVFAFFFKSFYWGFRISIIVGLLLIFHNSREALTLTWQQALDTYYTIKSWLYDEKVDLGSLLKKLNPKPEALKTFRLTHRAIFKLPNSRRVLLNVISENYDMIQPCKSSVQSIIESIQSELVSMNNKLTIGSSIVVYLNKALDTLTGCEYAISILADLISMIDLAVQDHLQAYSNDLTSMSLHELTARIGIIA